MRLVIVNLFLLFKLKIFKSFTHIKFVNTGDSGEWTGASIGMQNAGGVRSGFTRGNVIYADVISVIPFENIYNLVELPGSAIREVLEFAVSNTSSMNVMQVSGIRVIYDMNRKSYDRIVDLKVLCQTCLIPRYEEIDNAKDYRVVMPAYLADGGDGFTMIPTHTTFTITGPRDVDAVSEYIEKNSPISTPPIRNRIKFL